MGLACRAEGGREGDAPGREDKDASPGHLDELDDSEASSDSVLPRMRALPRPRPFLLALRALLLLGLPSRCVGFLHLHIRFGFDLHNSLSPLPMPPSLLPPPLRDDSQRRMGRDDDVGQQEVLDGEAREERAGEEGEELEGGVAAAGED